MRQYEGIVDPWRGDTTAVLQDRVKGWNMRFLPTRPLEFASPLGNRDDVEFNRIRGVPIPLQATITTSAG
jgi:hypothetical protein